jgi:hypothetical protein
MTVPAELLRGAAACRRRRVANTSRLHDIGRRTLASLAVRTAHDCLTTALLHNSALAICTQFARSRWNFGIHHLDLCAIQILANPATMIYWGIAKWSEVLGATSWLFSVSGGRAVALLSPHSSTKPPHAAARHVYHPRLSHMEIVWKLFGNCLERRAEGLPAWSKGCPDD